MQKELQFASDETRKLSDYMSNTEMFRSYLRLLRHPCDDVPNDVDFYHYCYRVSDLHQAPLTIDATPVYLEFSPSVPLKFRMLSPQGKVIVMLREPMSRATSLYNHWKSNDGHFQNKSFSDIAQQFLEYVANTKGIAAILKRIRHSTSLYEVSQGYAQLQAMGLLETVERQVFSFGLYKYALAGWQLHYFKPGRVLVIDSTSYFKNRTAALQTTIKFLYNRSMTTSEQKYAAQTFIARSAKQYVPEDVGSPYVISQLRRFYYDHVVSKLPEVLNRLRQEGAWIVGFQQHSYSATLNW